MKINQAFEILKNVSDIRIARIIIGDKKNISGIKVLWYAYLLKRGVPVAKIIHEKWFYGLKFYTNKYTLDPRPDSETLVEAVLKEEGKRQKAKGITILDLGTGTGCLIAAIVKNLPGSRGVAIDKSRAALRVARKNIHDLKLDKKIKVIYGNFSTPHSTLHTPHFFDVIISNPPYIAMGDTHVNDAALHDPKISLFAKNNGLAAYESIAKNAKKWIAQNGKIYLEIGMGQGDAVRKIFTRAGWQFAESFNDLSGIERVLVFSC